MIEFLTSALHIFFGGLSVYIIVDHINLRKEFKDLQKEHDNLLKIISKQSQHKKSNADAE